MHDGNLFPRTRDLTDAMGSRLRVTVAPHGGSSRVKLEQPDARGRPQAVLDGYGAEVLAGYIMAARLSLPQGLADECVGGAIPSRFRLTRSPAVALTITQGQLERPFAIPATFWDRLYAELCIVNAHARAIERAARVHADVFSTADVD